MSVPVLETARLHLRPLEMADAPAMLAYGSDPEIARMGMWPPLANLAESEADIQSVLEGYQAGEQWTWAIEERGGATMIGRCDLLKYRRLHRNAEVGYTLARQVWGKGYATEALHALVQFAFSDLQLHRLEALVLDFNHASIRVLEKVGMQREGVKHEAYFADDHFVDLFCYGLLAQDYHGAKTF
jgi:[ribosomal protein S5]-alanine N-acetyltransferase